MNSAHAVFLIAFILIAFGIAQRVQDHYERQAAVEVAAAAGRATQLVAEHRFVVSCGW